MKRVLGVVIVAAAVLMAGCDFILGPDEPLGNLVIGFGEGGAVAGPNRPGKLGGKWRLLLHQREFRQRSNGVLQRCYGHRSGGVAQ
jgi:hypothetical protein